MEWRLEQTEITDKKEALRYEGSKQIEMKPLCNHEIAGRTCTEYNRQRSKEKIAAYYQQSKEHRKEWYETNRDSICQKSNEYYHKNKETISEERKKKYQENKDTICQKRMDYYNKNKERINQERKQKYAKKKAEQEAQQNA